MPLYPFHPIVECFDPLTPEQFGNLRNSITANLETGAPVYVTVWDDGDNTVIIDGRHRSTICDELGITPVPLSFHGSEEHAIRHAINLNHARRHTPKDRRVIEAARAAQVLQASRKTLQESKETQKNTGLPNGSSTSSTGVPSTVVPSEPGQAVDIAAEMFEVAPRQVYRAKAVLDHGTPELQEAMVEGVVSISDAAEVSKETPEAQKEAVAKVRQKKARTAKAAVESSVSGDADESAPPELEDAVGVKVPLDAIKAFQAAGDIEKVCANLDSMVRWVQSSAKLPGWEMVQADSVLQNLRNLRTNLWASRATHVCPAFVQGRHREGEECSCCKGRLWIVKALYAAAASQ